MYLTVGNDLSLGTSGCVQTLPNTEMELHKNLLSHTDVSRNLICDFIVDEIKGRLDFFFSWHCET